MLFDAMVVGGSYAGISAALFLARARRQVLVIDAGVRRNRFASHAHGLLGHDGRPPGDIAASGRADLMAYPTVTWVDGKVAKAHVLDDAFEVQLESGALYTGRRVVLAGGVTDTLPAVEGIEALWGQGVYHCPYCHGYELEGGDVAVLAAGPAAFHVAMMLPDWGRTTLYTNGMFQPDAEHTAQLTARGVRIDSRDVRSLSRDDKGVRITLASGESQSVAGVFTQPATAPAGDLVTQLGCALEDSPIGRFVTTGPTKETTVPGVFACGDIARAAGSVPLAIGDGVMAGTATHQSIVFRPH
ncbi:thioredoxin reductase [Luteibacter sp. Sphag1AF]|uniref:NAD(P)/FAD-dependent oxidoreductase n=1 Tax=Luteibacter sp. Sphag1AF TaxID=2587031 RepID=UPI00162132F5|nr:NAD(P)/FAD-dependent oxidoreductase [Luteibacter sp. Sphag1AF]MBB3228656.1 thioredoxin reductase [Luteibacter sp. Sphag1AF]